MAGHPTDYKPEYVDQVYKLCLLGATNQQIADFFNVSDTTIDNWRKAHQEFFGAFTRGKMEADSKVAESLFKRACGVTIKEEALTRDGDVVTLRKELPPDTPAAKHWLSNRQPDRWRDGSVIKHEFDNRPPWLDAAK
jgi:transposase-like protein